MSSAPCSRFGYANGRERFCFPQQVLLTQIRQHQSLAWHEGRTCSNPPSSAMKTDSVVYNIFTQRLSGYCIQLFSRYSASDKMPQRAQSHQLFFVPSCLSGKTSANEARFRNSLA